MVFSEFFMYDSVNVNRTSPRVKAIAKYVSSLVVRVRTTMHRVDKTEFGIACNVRSNPFLRLEELGRKILWRRFCCSVKMRSAIIGTFEVVWKNIGFIQKPSFIVYSQNWLGYKN